MIVTGHRTKYDGWFHCFCRCLSVNRRATSSSLVPGALPWSLVHMSFPELRGVPHGHVTGPVQSPVLCPRSCHWSRPGGEEVPGLTPGQDVVPPHQDRTCNPINRIGISPGQELGVWTGTPHNGGTLPRQESECYGW